MLVLFGPNIFNFFLDTAKVWKKCHLHQRTVLAIKSMIYKNVKKCCSRMSLRCEAHCGCCRCLRWWPVRRRNHGFRKQVLAKSAKRQGSTLGHQSLAKFLDLLRKICIYSHHLTLIPAVHVHSPNLECVRVGEIYANKNTCKCTAKEIKLNCCFLVWIWSVEYLKDPGSNPLT
jgi:hypothetical protein